MNSRPTISLTSCAFIQLSIELLDISHEIILEGHPSANTKYLIPTAHIMFKRRVAWYCGAAIPSRQVGPLAILLENADKGLQNMSA
jgi:hypothetical protein